jgi:hypothetical protein
LFLQYLDNRLDQNINPELSRNLLFLADFFQIKALKKYCVDSLIIPNLAPQNALQFLTDSYKQILGIHNFNEEWHVLFFASLDYVVNNIKFFQFNKEPQFFQFPNFIILEEIVERVMRQNIHRRDSETFMSMLEILFKIRRSANIFELLKNERERSLNIFKKKSKQNKGSVWKVNNYHNQKDKESPSFEMDKNKWIFSLQTQPHSQFTYLSLTLQQNSSSESSTDWEANEFNYKKNDTIDLSAYKNIESYYKKYSKPSSNSSSENSSFSHSNITSPSSLSISQHIQSPTSQRFSDNFHSQKLKSSHSSTPNTTNSTNTMNQINTMNTINTNNKTGKTKGIQDVRGRSCCSNSSSSSSRILHKPDSPIYNAAASAAASKRSRSKSRIKGKKKAFVSINDRTKKPFSYAQEYAKKNGRDKAALSHENSYSNLDLAWNLITLPDSTQSFADSFQKQDQDYLNSSPALCNIKSGNSSSAFNKNPQVSAFQCAQSDDPFNIPSCFNFTPRDHAESLLKKSLHLNINETMEEVFNNNPNKFFILSILSSVKLFTNDKENTPTLLPLIIKNNSATLKMRRMNKFQMNFRAFSMKIHLKINFIHSALLNYIKEHFNSFDGEGIDLLTLEEIKAVLEYSQIRGFNANLIVKNLMLWMDSNLVNLANREIKSIVSLVNWPHVSYSTLQQLQIRNTLMENSYLRAFVQEQLSSRKDGTLIHCKNLNLIS